MVDYWCHRPDISMYVKTLFISTLLLTNVFASEVYFSPNGGARDQIIKRINLSRSSIDIAMYSLTSGDIAEALARAAKRGIRVRIVRDRSQSRDRNDENQFLIQSGIQVEIRTGKGRGIMHNKFAIFDGKEVCTGSYNWTNNAEHFNYENLICTDEKKVIESYRSEFVRLWN